MYRTTSENIRKYSYVSKLFTPQFYMLEFCSFHSGEPEFPNIQFKNSTLPMGEYPCCGETAIRFQPLFQVRISLFVWLRCGLLVSSSTYSLKITKTLLCLRELMDVDTETIRLKWRIQKNQRCIWLWWLTGKFHLEIFFTIWIWNRDLICISPKRRQSTIRTVADNSISIPSSQSPPRREVIFSNFLFHI